VTRELLDGVCGVCSLRLILIGPRFAADDEAVELAKQALDTI